MVKRRPGPMISRLDAAEDQALASHASKRRVRDAVLRLRSGSRAPSLVLSPALQTRMSLRQHLQTRSRVGADLIIGHHPHVPQAAGWIQAQGRERPTLIAYSLGNALFDQTAPPGSRAATVLPVTADQNGIQSACAAAFEIDPLSWELRPAGEAARLLVLRSLKPGARAEPQGSTIGLCP